LKTQTDVSEEHAASILRVEKWTKQETDLLTASRCFLFGIFFDPEEGGNMILLNFG
jgi:hypothetical protein